jgi:hypothetical protein
MTQPQATHPLAKQIKMAMDASKDHLGWLLVQYQPRRPERPNVLLRLAAFFIAAAHLGILHLEDGHGLVIHVKGSSISIKPYEREPRPQPAAPAKE